MGERLAEQGGFIVGRCSVCKDVTRHTILSIAEEKPTLVKCSNCDDQHKYKAPPPSRAEKERIAAERLRQRMLEEDRQRWSLLKPNMIEAKAKDYSMDGLFRKKDVIRHPGFGLGLVEKKAGPRKVEVLFEDGRKVMRCQ